MDKKEYKQKNMVKKILNKNTPFLMVENNF